MYEGFVSVDLGRQRDFTAIIVSEEAVWVGQRPELSIAPTQDELMAESMYDDAGVGWMAPSSLKPYQRRYFRDLSYAGQRPDRPPLLVRHIERVRGRPYPQIVGEIGELLQRPPLAGLSVAVLLDCGGVGVAVSDYAWQAGIAHVSITATAGNAVHVADDGRTIHCPKRELVAAGQIALAQGRIRIAASLTHASTLVHELQRYQVRISSAGHDSYSARENEHDDLTYALSQMAWYRDWFSQHLDDHIAASDRVLAAQIQEV